jgi:hypothetical protein
MNKWPPTRAGLLFLKQNYKKSKIRKNKRRAANYDAISRRYYKTFLEASHHQMSRNIGVGGTAGTFDRTTTLAQ